ncbi:unnamed protein product [Parnassius mnemosyne]|uniref:Retrotransposon gag domain-containing protein n=1 Tax=Parnassius mnemosyne TaxID=213953 RepID=A0AAV1LI50_9NEOP
MSKCEETPCASKNLPMRGEAEEKFVEIGVLLKFIKPFDGSRGKLNPFISNCQNAYSLASKSQKSILFKYILSQLEGRAETTCSIKDFESFEQFLEFLKQQFGERKHYSHLLSDLQDCKQNATESVNQFALRIETCLAKFLTEINISIPTKRKTELSGRVAAMEDLALHTFVIGLHPRLSQIVRCRDPDSLNSAVNFAVAEEKILSSIGKRPQPPQSQPIYNERRSPPRRNIPFQQNYRTDNFRPNTNVFCRYCKSVGHTIENCRKRQYNHSKQQFGTSTSQGPPHIFQQRGEHTPHKIHSVEQVGMLDQGHDEVDHNLNE